MKLRLPLPLRTAVMTCLSALATIAPTLATGSLIVGATTVTLSQLAMSETISTDLTFNDGTTSASTNLADATAEGTYGIINLCVPAKNVTVAVEGVTINVAHAENSDAWSGFRFSQPCNGLTYTFSSTKLTGDGNFLLGFMTGGGGSTATATLSFSDESTFSGRLLLLNAYTRPMTVSYSGTSLSNAEVILGTIGTAYKIAETTDAGAKTITAGAAATATYTLRLTDNATLSGVSAGVTSSYPTPVLTATSSGKTLTLTGGCTTNQTYTFAGNVGASSTTINLAVTGGNQTFSGTSYLGTVSVQNSGKLTLGGTTTLTSATVGNGATLTVSGKLLFSTKSDSTLIANSGTVDMSGMSELDITAFLEDVELREGATGTINLVTADSTVTAPASWDDVTITSGKEGLKWTYSNGVLSYEYTLVDLVYSSESDLTWTSNVGGFDDSKTFSSGANVEFTGRTNVTLGEAITAGKVTIDNGSVITLTGNGNKLTASSVAVNGTLTLKDEALANNTSFDASGTGTLKIDVGTENGGEFTTANSVKNFAGTLQIESGRFKTEETLNASAINVVGGQLWVNAGTHSNPITLSGTGWNGDSSDAKMSGSALRIDNAATLSSTVTAGDGVSICCSVYNDWDKRGVITGTLAGSGTLYKTGKGALQICGQNGSGNITHTGDLVIQEGTVVIGNFYTHNNTVSFNSVTVEIGTKFEFHHASTTAADSLYNTDIILNGGYFGNSLGAAATLTFGNVSVNAAETTTTIHCNHANSKILINSLALNHSVSLTGSGAVVATDTVVNVASETSATLAGSLTTANFSKTGEGSWALASGASLSITGELAMNYEGSFDLTGGTLVLNDGVTLTYTEADGKIATAESGISLMEGDSANLIGISASNLAEGVSSIGIDVSAILSGALPQTIHLGISTDVSQDILSVKQGAYYDLDTTDDGYYVLTYHEDTSGWDENWGESVLENAPTPTPTYITTEYTEDIDEGGNIRHVYALGEVQSDSEHDYTDVNLVGTDATPTIVVGGIYAAASDTGSTQQKDSWIKATAGDYLALVGGNLANNWNGSGASDFNADSHILVDGATVGTLIGGNYKDAKNSSMTGDSYISVKSGDVTGAIIGASLAIFGSESSFTGNTNIFIYKPLNTNTSNMWGESNDIICGGFAAGYWGGKQTLTGDTHITVDLTAYVGDEESFGKTIIGGNVGYNGSEQTLNGNTDVSVNLKGLTDNKSIVGGSWINGANQKSTITGSTNVTIGDGVFTYIVGGTFSNNASSIIAATGATNVTIEKGTVYQLIGSSVGSNSSGDFTAGDSTVTISGNSASVLLLSGGFYYNESEGDIDAEIGDITVDLKDGSLYQVYGGTLSYGNGEVSQKNITINLTGGQFISEYEGAFVFAAGGAFGDATITTESTEVNISSKVTLGSTLISGGYGSDQDDVFTSTVTGDRTLVFGDAETYSNLGNAQFYDFDVVEVTEENGVAALNGGIMMRNGATDDATSYLSFEKTGAGTLIINAATQEDVTVSEGTLSMGTGGNTTSSVAVGKGAVLSLGSGGTNNLSVVTVNEGGTLAATDGGTSLGGSLTLASGSSLSVSQKGDGIDLNKNVLTWIGMIDLSVSSEISTTINLSVDLLTNVSEWIYGEVETYDLDVSDLEFAAADYISSFTDSSGATIDLSNFVLQYINGTVSLVSLETLPYGEVLDATGNAAVGAEMIDEANKKGNKPQSGTPLAEIIDRVDDLIDEGNLSEARKLAASLAGSTVTALGHAQKNALRDQMGMIRDRMGTLGVNDLVVNEDLPNFHLWAQGNGNYAKLDSKGDQAGYTLSTWGGTVGADADFNENLSAGIAFTAAWGDLDATAAETASGDLDGYYLNLYAQFKGSRQTHKLILTGATFDATLNRTVQYGTGSYRTEGSTNGSGFGAMYEGSYDFYLNEDRDAVFRPWINLSVVHSQTDAYTETGDAGNAALRVGEQEMTTATFAAGVSVAGALSENLLGRPVWGEFRAGVSQDVGDDRSTADAGLTGMSGYAGTLKGAKEGRTALQLGAGLNVPVGEQSNIYFNVNASFRSHASSVSGSVGYRYDF